MSVVLDYGDLYLEYKAYLAGSMEAQENVVVQFLSASCQRMYRAVLAYQETLRASTRVDFNSTFEKRRRNPRHTVRASECIEQPRFDNLNPAVVRPVGVILSERAKNCLIVSQTASWVLWYLAVPIRL